MREEDVVLVSGRDAMAGVCDNNFNRVQVDAGAGFDGDIFDRRGFERLGGIVNQIHNNAAEQGSIRANRRRLRSERSAERDAVEAVRENFDGFSDDVVHVSGIEFSRRKTDELGEFIHKCGERANLAFDQARRFFDEPCKFRIARTRILSVAAFFQITQKPLRGELNGCEGILDFVSNAARHFLPGRGFLRAKKFSKVVEHEHEA